ncbi:CoA transferase [Sinimarinibacterium sp. CAU 1509]|uniref:CoA transferase n=1 Tax=Sinimarinibacterium sp. CAU 1509 TaxID=2562283 RepID=UPI0010AB969F|nr:CoA transferase [Sinimarinibacterium sp. CAU 1509]TJY58939.1 CoA transferase [Sinimarinibacterium sp. CAU 1509]
MSAADQEPDRAGIGAVYARRLLEAVGYPSITVELAAEHPALSAARCGLMALTGPADGAPLPCPAPLAACADGALAALAALAPMGALDGLRGANLLTERAAIAGHVRAGSVSPGGSCHLLQTADGAIALSLTRDDDWELLPAWLRDGSDIGAGNWGALAANVRGRTMQALVEDGRELGLAVCPMAPPSSRPVPWVQRVAGRGYSGAAALPRRAPRVVDLSSLWAGPLCSHLLQRCGADVVKVESLSRPDGARRGPPAFFDLLNAGKRSVALDFSTAQGRRQLQALLARADIVIEASRPRALRQLGIDAEAMVQAHPALSWISINGYGRAEPMAQWIAYGDDAGVAAGLSRMMFEVFGQRVIVGDAIADPLTGLHAALAAWAGFRQGGAGLLSIALTDVVRHCIAADLVAGTSLRERTQVWRQRVDEAQSLLRAGEVAVAVPQARVAEGAAAMLGADTDAVLRDWGVAC